MTNEQASTRPAGAGGFYLAAAMGTAISATTSWGFFGKVLHIDGLYERAAMFAVLETLLIACGWATRANVRRPDGRPGAARMWAWVLCGGSAYMAVVLSGPVEGIARVLFGPVLAVVALHLALGIEIRAKHGEDTGTWGRVRAEVRERFLSRLGLGDDQRDALARSRDRARDRAARLATATGWVPARRRRLVRAVRASGVALDEAQQVRLIKQVGAFRHVDRLATMDLPDPWAPHEVVPQPAAEDLTEVVRQVVGEVLTEHRTQHLTGDIRRVLTEVLTEDRSGPLTEVVGEVITKVLTEPLSGDLKTVITEVVTETLAESSRQSPPKTPIKTNATTDKIGKLRRRQPTLTQRQVAERLEMSAATVQRYWAITTPGPAADQPRTNGTPVPELTTIS